MTEDTPTPGQLDLEILEPWLGQGARWESLSATNNLVFRLEGNRGRLVLKLIRDRDIDVWEQAHTCIALTATDLRSPAVLAAYMPPGLLPRLATEAIAGMSFARRIASGASLDELWTMARFSLLAVDAVPRVIALPAGFGPMKRTRPMHASLEEYQTAFVERYLGRLERHAPQLDWSDARRTLTDVLGAHVGAVDHQVMGADLNLKNFMLCEDGPRLLNIPILARSTRAHAFAAATVHYRGTPIHSWMCAHIEVEPREHLLCEALELLGILAFYARGGAQAVREARMFGSGAGIHEQLSRVIQELAPA